MSDERERDATRIRPAQTLRAERAGLKERQRRDGGETKYSTNAIRCVCRVSVTQDTLPLQ